MFNVEYISLQERGNPLELKKNLSKTELGIIEDYRKTYGRNVLDVVVSSTGLHSLKAQQFVGIIPLIDRVVRIEPKIPKISFINMIRYGDLSVLTERFPVSEADDYLDLIIIMLLYEVDNILRKGPNHAFIDHEADLGYIRGKILFKQQLLINHDRPDRVYCKFSELSQDTIENLF